VIPAAHEPKKPKRKERDPINHHRKVKKMARNRGDTRRGPRNGRRRGPHHRGGGAQQPKQKGPKDARVNVV